MDPATVTAATFTVAGVSGTVNYDAPSRTARLVPAGPLPVGTVSGSIVGATDLAGNPVTTNAFSFRTAPQSVRLSSLTSPPPTLGSPTVAFNNAGQALAVWSANSGAGFQIMTARFDGTSWQPEAVVANCLGSVTPSASVASNGTSFLVVYRACSGTIMGRVLTGATFSPEFQIGALAAPVGVIASGSTYLVVGANTFVTSDGTTLGPMGTCPAGGVRAAGSGNRFMVVCGGNSTSGNLTTYFWNGGSWSAPFTIRSSTQTSGYNVSLKGGPLGFTLAYTSTTSTMPSTTNLYARTWSGTGPWSAETTLAGPSASTSFRAAQTSVVHMVAVQSPTGVMVSSTSGLTPWSTVTATTSTLQPTALTPSGASMLLSVGALNHFVYDGNDWGTATTIDGDNVAGNGIGGFAVGAAASSQAVAYLFNGSTWSGPLTVDATMNTRPRMFTRSGGYAAFWNDTAVLKTSRTTGGAFGAIASATRNAAPFAASALRPALIRNGNFVVAVWEHHNNDQLHAAAFDGTTWSAPIQLGAISAVSRAPALVPVGAGRIMVVWVGSSCHLRIYDGPTGTWGPLVTPFAGASDCSISHHLTGFLAGYRQTSGLYAATSSDGSSFTPGLLLNTNGTNPYAVSSSGVRMVVYTTSGQINSAEVAGSTLTQSSFAGTTPLSVAAHPLGLGVAVGFSSGGSGFARRHFTTGWEAASPALPSAPQVVPASSSFLAVSDSSTVTITSWANTTGWSSPFSLTPPPGLYALGFVGSARYALSAGSTLEGWVLGEGGPYGSIDSPAGGSYWAPMLAGGASTLDGIWLRNDGGQSGYEVWAALGL